MIYDLKNILDRERFKRRSNELYKKQCVIELTEKKPVRTLRQNAYLHLLLGYFAIETGNTIEYVKQEYFKKLCNKELFMIEKQDKYLGKVTILKSTADLTTAEMSIAIDRFINWAANEPGICLPSPNEKEFLTQIQIEIERNNRYL